MVLTQSMAARLKAARLKATRFKVARRMPVSVPVAVAVRLTRSTPVAGSIVANRKATRQKVKRRKPVAVPLAVLTRSMAARRKPLPLPLDMMVEIAGQVAATSPHPMEDLCSLRASCQDMRRACRQGAVGRCVALEREKSMRWFHNDRYIALVDNLAAIGNPEACYVLGLSLVFVNPAPFGIQWLRQAADVGHKVAAYVLGVLHYSYRHKQEAERYIRQVEDEGLVALACKQAASMANRECVRCRAHAVQAILDVSWNMATTMGPVPPADDGQGCNGNGCGLPEGWASDYTVFCSKGCRIRHEYYEFFWRVPMPVI